MGHKEELRTLAATCDSVHFMRFCGACHANIGTACQKWVTSVTPHLGGDLGLGAQLDGREAQRGDSEDSAVAQLALRHHDAVLCGIACTPLSSSAYSSPDLQWRVVPAVKREVHERGARGLTHTMAAGISARSGSHPSCTIRAAPA